MVRISYEQLVSQWNKKRDYDKEEICVRLGIPLKHAEKTFNKFPDKYMKLLISVLYTEIERRGYKKKNYYKENTKQAPTYYEMLGVSNNATEDEIKDAFRKQILKWHSDKNQSVEDIDEYTKILYEVRDTLIDFDKRKDYDYAIS